MDNVQSLRFLYAFYGRGKSTEPYKASGLVEAHRQLILRDDGSVLKRLLNKALQLLSAEQEKVLPDSSSTSKSLAHALMLTASPLFPIMKRLLDGFPIEAVFPGRVCSDSEALEVSVVADQLINHAPHLILCLLECYMRGLVGPIGVNRLTFQRDVLSRPQVRSVGGRGKDKGEFEGDCNAEGEREKNDDGFGPIFVVGLPRTGTALMQSLLALDSENRTPRNYEFQRPCSFWTRKHRMSETDRQTKSGSKGGGGSERNNVGTGTGMDKAGHMRKGVASIGGNANAPAEDSVLFQGIGGPILAAFDSTDAPGLVEMNLWNIEERDLVDKMCLHRLTARLLEKQDPVPFKRWVFKDSTHLHTNMEAIVKVYPQARFVWMHRRMDEVFCSMTDYKVNMLRLHNRSLSVAAKRGLAFRETGSYDYYEDEVGSIKKNSQEWRFQDVYLDELVSNPVETLRKLYGEWGLDVNKKHERSVRKWTIRKMRPKRTCNPSPLFKLFMNRGIKMAEEYNSRFFPEWGIENEVEADSNEEFDGDEEFDDDDYDDLDDNGVDDDDEEGFFAGSTSCRDRAKERDRASMSTEDAMELVTEMLQHREDGLFFSEEDGLSSMFRC